MAGWIDFFVLVHSDANTECWEFDHAGWRSPPESARFRIRVDKTGATVIVGVTDAKTGVLTWVADDEPWQEFEEAAYQCIDKYFAQDCIVHRYDFQREADTSAEWELDCANSDTDNSERECAAEEPISFRCSDSHLIQS